jgi:hypothetical protein
MTAKCVSVTKPRRQRCPRPSEQELERRTGLSSLVTPFAISQAIAVPNGGTAAIVRTLLGAGREAYLTHWAAGWPGNWTTSPVWAALFDLITQNSTNGTPQTYSGVVANANTFRRKLGPFGTPVGSLAQPLDIRPHGLFVPEGADVGLVITSREAIPMTASGYIAGFSWSHNASEEVRKHIEEWACLTPPWTPGSVFGGA